MSTKKIHVHTKFTLNLATGDQRHYEPGVHEVEKEVADHTWTQHFAKAMSDEVKQEETQDDESESDEVESQEESDETQDDESESEDAGKPQLTKAQRAAARRAARKK
jgi:hypothetical protein